MLLQCVYGSFAVLGGGYLLLSFILGEFFHLGDGHIDHVDHVDHLDDNDGGHLPFRVIVMFFAAFGAGGLAALAAGQSNLVTIVPALLFGLTGGAAMWGFLRVFMKEEVDSGVQANDFLNLVGSVDVSIPRGKSGLVAIQVKLQNRLMPAVSKDGQAISKGASVRVVTLDGGTLIVEPID